MEHPPPSEQLPGEVNKQRFELWPSYVCMQAYLRNQGKTTIDTLRFCPRNHPVALVNRFLKRFSGRTVLPPHQGVQLDKRNT